MVPETTRSIMTYGSTEPCSQGLSGLDASSQSGMLGFATLQAWCCRQLCHTLAAATARHAMPCQSALRGSKSAQSNVKEPFFLAMRLLHLSVRALALLQKSQQQPAIDVAAVKRHAAMHQQLCSTLQNEAAGWAASAVCCATHQY